MKLTLPEIVGPDGLFVDGDWVESKDQDPNGNVRLIQLADIGDGEYLNKSNRFLTSEKTSELKCTFIQPGDILIARLPDPLGRACVFPGDEKPCIVAVDICIVRPGKKQVDRNWLLRKINSTDFRFEISRYSSGTTRKRISRRNLGKIKLIELTPGHIQALYDQRLQDGVGPRTVQLVHAVIHRCLNHAVKIGVLSRNPDDATIPPKPKKKEMAFFDEDQVQRFLIVAQANQLRFFPLFRLAVTTGMRQGELLGLNWDDIDWDRREIHVRRQVRTLPGGGLELAPPKHWQENGRLA